MRADTGKSKFSRRITKRLKYIDAAKGIVIILVVVGHIMSYEPLHINETLKGFIYSFHMPAFFCISGFTLYLSLRNSNSTDIRRRYKKIAVSLLGAYFLWSFLYYVAKSMIGNPDKGEWFLCVFSLRGRAPLWFLAALYLAETMFLVIVGKEYSKQKGRFIGKGIAVLVASIFITVILNSGAIPQPDQFSSIAVEYIAVTIYRIFPTLSFIALGYILGALLTDEKKRVSFMGLVSGLCLIGVFAAEVIFENEVNFHLFVLGNTGIFYFTGIFGSLMIIFAAVSVRVFGKNSILALFGRESLGIMVIHYTPFPVMEAAIAICTGLGLSSQPVLLIVGTALTLCISCFMSLMIKKNLLL